MINTKLSKAVAVVLSSVFLFASMPVAPISAATNIKLTPEAGKVGESVEIAGIMSTASSAVDAYFSSQDVSLSGSKYIGSDVTKFKKVLSTNVVSVSDQGFFQGVFNVPQTLDIAGGGQEVLFHDGYHYVYVTHKDSTLIRGKERFWVTGFSAASLNTTHGFVGDELIITGEGFKPGENIQVRFIDSNVDMNITGNLVGGSPEVSSTEAAKGTFSIVVPVPAVSYGQKIITIKGLSSQITVDLIYNVMSKITLMPLSGEAGSQVTVRGTGFAWNNFVNIYMGATLVKQTPERTSSGGFLEPFNVPADIEPGVYEIRAVDANNISISAVANFTVQPPPYNPEISLSQASVKVGDTVQINGLDFRPGETVTLMVNGRELATESTVNTNSNGDFAASFVVPELAGGSHTIKATDGVEDASAVINVNYQLEITPESGITGTVVTVTGNGLAAGAAASVTFDGIAQVTTPAGAAVNAHGSLVFTFIIPPGVPGSHKIEVKAGSATLVKPFVTNAHVQLSTQSSAVGMHLTVNAVGFAPGSPAIISFSGSQLATINTSQAGSLNIVFAVPHVPEGTHELKIEVAGTVVTKNVTTVAEVYLAPSQGPVGTALNLTGFGFGPEKLLAIYWEGQPLATSPDARVNSEGAFNVVFSVPVAASGNYIISVSDGLITKNKTFTLVATTPPAPVPVAPLMREHLRGDLEFGWLPIDYDYMDVTYEFQIIRNILEPELIFGKAELEETEYTLTSDEKLEKANEESPYYWRVRAVDEAGNVGPWSVAGEFYYGFFWPSWLTWLLVGVGVVVLGIVIYLLRRHIAYLFY